MAIIVAEAGSIVDTKNAPVINILLDCEFEVEFCIVHIMAGNYLMIRFAKKYQSIPEYSS